MIHSRLLIPVIVGLCSFLIFRYFTGMRLMQIETESSIYRGLESTNRKIAIFYGVPYAEPPPAERRFRAPVPLRTTRSEGEAKAAVNAWQQPPFCVQGSVNPDGQEPGGAGSEDCLRLNIYTPMTALKTGQLPKLPVLVYIHGGGFLYGNPLSWPFEHWVEQFPNTVIVSIYYRLSIFGFLAAPSGFESATIDSNAGFLDQLEALRWVKKNIGTFGGDAKRMTISGQSAGAASVLLHLLANGGKQDLFQQAIAQSVYRPGLRRIPETKEHFDHLVQYTHCNISGYAEIDQVNCLRRKEVASLMRATEAAQRENPAWKYLPVVDGALFQDTPTTLMNEGKISRVSILTGSTTDETFCLSDSMEVEMRRWYPAITKRVIMELGKIYPASQYSTLREAVSFAVGETLNRCGSQTLVELMIAAGKPGYLYRFDEPNPTQPSMLVEHSADNWWMFRGSNTGGNGTYDLTPFTNRSQDRFSKELVAYWVSFVHTGNPNTFRLQNSPEWPAWQAVKVPMNGQRMVLKQGGILGNMTGSFIESVSSKVLERCHAVNRMAEGLSF